MTDPHEAAFEVYLMEQKRRDPHLKHLDIETVWNAAFLAGAKEERETCAEIASAETQNSSGESREGRSYENVYERACRTIADAIRHRGA